MIGTTLIIIPTPASSIWNPEKALEVRLAAEMLRRESGCRGLAYIPTYPMNKQKAIIDGSNAAYLQAPREPRPNIRNISAIADAVEASGLEPIIIIDPTIRSLIVDVDELERLLSDRRVTVVPSGIEIARFVLETAQKVNALIISNNTYAQHYEDYPWIEERRIPVTIVNGAVVLLDHKMKQAS